MEELAGFLDGIENKEHMEKLSAVFSWVRKTFPQLDAKIAWNQPVFTNHDTFIIGFSVAKNHFSFSPEGVVIQKFSDEIKKAGYTHTNNLVRVLWNQPVDYVLLKKIIRYNMKDKAGHNKFWR